MRFSDWSEGGIGRPAIPSEQREENAVRGPESARSNTGGGATSLECSPPARQRRAALEDGATDERSRSEGTLSENAWPRAKTADGGRDLHRVDAFVSGRWGGAKSAAAVVAHLFL